MRGFSGRSIRGPQEIICLLAIVFSLGIVIPLDRLHGQGHVIIGQQQFDAEDQFFGGQGVYLPTERTLSRGIRQAEEDLRAGQYSRAIEFLVELLERDEDLFLSSPDESNNAQGLKGHTRQLIRDLPPQGRVVYEVQNAAHARKQLARAAEQRDEKVLARVARNYFDTPAGYEAAWMLAQLETDRGHWSTASLIYQDLLESERARRALGPQLLVQAVLHQIAGGQSEIARGLLDRFLADFKGMFVEVDGRDVPISELETLLFQNLSPDIIQADGRPTNWTLNRGNNARSSEGQGGLPLIRERWRVRVVNEPRAEGYLAGRELELRGQGLGMLPVASPIAVDGVIVFSTPRNIVAVDWETGKRIWETRPDPDDRFEEVVEGLTPFDGQEEGVANGLALDQRIWEDAVTVSLSSDGARVFSVRGSPFSPDDPWGGWGGNVMWGNANPTASPTNRLSAFDLATEGKLVWEIDGARSTGAFENVFCLGAPLALDGTVYVLGEVNSAVYLFALEPTSGKLLWQQQVASLERGIAFDPTRRSAGANLAYSDGILVCPTGAGMVVGIDLLSRSLVWAYSIQVDERSAQIPIQVWQRARARHLEQNAAAWLDSSPVIAGGRVLMMSPESSELHCFSLASGEPLWKVITREALYLACVVDDVVLVAEPHALQGIRLSDGAAAWQETHTPLPSGALPSGRGFVSKGHYLLPLTTGEVISVDVASGKVEGAVVAREGLVLGNLIYFRDAVVSQNALFLDKFEQADALERRALATLEQNTDEATALRDLGELRLARGELAQSKQFLIRAHQRDQNDRLTSELLSECLLALLAADFSEHRDELDLLRSLVRSRQQEIQLLRTEIQGYTDVGEPLEAFEKCLHLIEVIGSEIVMLPLARQYDVRSDVWIRQQLAAIWLATSVEERRDLQQSLDAWRKSSTWRGMDSLEAYLSYFGDLPDAYEARLELASELASHRNAVAAELELLKLEQSDSEQARAAASALMAELLYTQGDASDAGEYGALLSGLLADHVVWRGKTGSQWLSDLLAQSEGQETPTSIRWPSGNWTAKVTPSKSRRRSNDGRNDFDRQQNLRGLRIEQMVGPAVGPRQFYFNGDQSLLIGCNRRGDITFRTQLPGERSRLPALRQFNMHHAARLGHLLIVSLGTEIVVIDTWRASESDAGSIVWREELISDRRLANVDRRRGAADRNLYDVRSNRKRLTVGAGQLVGVLGPISTAGIVYQVDDRLQCAEPLTGEVLWTRRDIPPGCELFGDEKVVCAVPSGEREGYLLATRDGRLLERRRFPPAPWLMTSGSRIVNLRQAGGKMDVVITDVASGNEILQTECDAHSQVHVIEPDRFAVMEPSGRFRVFHVPLAETVLDQNLLPERSLREIRILADHDQLFLFVNREIGAQHQPHMFIGVDYPLMTGPIYAFNLATGEKTWSAPATVANRGIALPLPDESPVLCFVDRVVRQGPSGSRGSLRVLCLEKSTGRSVYSDDALPDTAGGRFQIRVDPEGPTTVMETSASTIRLTRADGPRPPEPPAQNDVEARSDRQGGGLWEIGRRMGDVIQNALEDAHGTPQIDTDHILQEQEVDE